MKFGQQNRQHFCRFRLWFRGFWSRVSSNTTINLPANDRENATKYSLSFCRYSRSSLTIMAGVGVANKFPKKKKKKKKIQYKSSTKPPQLKLFTSSPQGQAYQAMSLPNPRSLNFGLKPINCLRRDIFGCKSIPSYNFPEEERKFQPVHISIRTVILKRVGSGTPVTSSLRQVPVLVNSD